METRAICPVKETRIPAVEIYRRSDAGMQFYHRIKYSIYGCTGYLFPILVQLDQLFSTVKV